MIITISIEEEDLIKIDEYAKKENRSRSNYLVNAGLERGEENDNN